MIGTKYTQGPWYVSGDLIVAYGGTAVARAAFVSNLPKQNANARLMSAAPDLLDALKNTLAQAKLFNRDTDAIWNAIKTQAEDAIAKAEGK